MVTLPSSSIPTSTARLGEPVESEKFRMRRMRIRQWEQEQALEDLAAVKMIQVCHHRYIHQLNDNIGLYVRGWLIDAPLLCGCHSRSKYATRRSFPQAQSKPSSVIWMECRGRHLLHVRGRCWITGCVVYSLFLSCANLDSLSAFSHSLASEPYRPPLVQLSVSHTSIHKRQPVWF